MKACRYLLAVISFLLMHVSYANFNDEVNAYKQTEKAIFKDNANKVNRINTMSKAQIASNLDLVNNFIAEASQSGRDIVKQKQVKGASLLMGQCSLSHFQCQNH